MNNENTIYMKLQNNIILEFNLNTGYCHLNSPSLLPFNLREKLHEIDYPENIPNIMQNQTAIMSFFSNRVLNINRENAKVILNSLNISQKSDFETNSKIILLCKALSVCDDYWITQNPNEKWEDVNLKSNPLHETIANIALTGKSLTVTGKIRTPELTGQGAYAKAWERVNGKLYLQKASTMAGHESEIEVSVSNILDCTNVPHVKYSFIEKEGRRIAVCENISSDELSLVSAEDFYGYCNRLNLNFLNEVKKINENLFFQTIVVDYLISNSDRHGGNWGFFMNNFSGQIEDMHPLFDHNNAFDNECMNDVNGGRCLLLSGKSQKEAAIYAINKCDFRITRPITKDLFVNSEMYESFSKRACELGLYKIQSRTLKNFFARDFSKYVPTTIKSDNSEIYYKGLVKIKNSIKNNMKCANQGTDVLNNPQCDFQRDNNTKLNIASHLEYPKMAKELDESQKIDDDNAIGKHFEKKTDIKCL